MDKIITKFEDVKHIKTEEYFQGNQFSIDAFKKKYALYEGEEYVQAVKRVCDFVASVEKTEQARQYWSARWFSEIYNDWWHPAGSIMQGAGSGRNVSLGNCTTLSLGTNRNEEEWDNLESIIKNTAYSVAKCAAYRQGLGVDFSRLRPSGAKVLNSANKSTGTVHWMKFIDNIASYVGQNGRIPAFLFSLMCTHPDIEEFITVKGDRKKIQNANISVQCTDKFYEAIEKDADWELRFDIPEIKAGDKIYIDVHSTDMNSIREKESGKYYKIAVNPRKKESIVKIVKARKLLELIAKNMHLNADPGIQNIDIARKYSNSDAMYDPADDFDSRIVSTNACSEQFLARENLCILASLNCGKFSGSPEIFIKQLELVGKSMNRFLDNVNECELVYKTFATPHQEIGIRKMRRTGAGLTNIAAWLFRKGLEYGTKEANNSIEEFMKIYNYWLYISTEELGRERGDFEAFNKEKWRNAPFVARMIKESEKIAEKYGTPTLKGTHARNVTVSSIAPTGSLSLMFRDFVFSYGIEPAFFLYYWKRTRISGKYEYYFCVPRIVREMFNEANIPLPMTSDCIKDTWDGKLGKVIAKIIDDNRAIFKFKEAPEISPMDKLQLMSQVMKWVDSSISVTYLLPIGSTWKDVYNFILEAHKKEVKCIAAFPDAKMYGIISKTPFKQLALNLQAENVEIHHQNFDDDELKELNLSRETIGSAVNCPSRLDTIDAEIHVATVKGQKFCIVVGVQNGQPYEIFGGHLNGLGLKSNFKKGRITKVKGGQYSLEFDDICIDDFSKQFTPTEQILFRMASLSLRHGVPIKFVVDQLQKATNDITSMGAAAARVLKKYIKNGELVHGQKCPDCGKALIYMDGCCSCSCGWSRCN